MIPEHVRKNRLQIVPPGKKFADGLAQNYLNTAPLSFQVNRPPKVTDFTQ